MNRRRGHLFLSGLDYYKTNPPENVKGSENNQYFDMTCGGFVILFGSYNSHITCYNSMYFTEKWHSLFGRPRKNINIISFVTSYIEPQISR